MNWWLIGVAILVVFVITRLLHFRTWKHKLYVTLFVIVAIFIYSSFSSVIGGSNIDLKNPSGMLQATKLYLSWFGQAFGNLKTLTGNAIRMDWLPGNSSFSS